MGINKVIVTGAGGLIGSEVVRYLVSNNLEVVGIDNNMRADFFGEKGDTSNNIKQLEADFPSFKNYALDIRSRDAVLSFIKDIRPGAVIHTAAQPSHDLAASRPFDDFDVNAVGTLNLLEANRCTDVTVPFVHLSTNKVYGDAPNFLHLVEDDTRYDFKDPAYYNGINENFPIDQSKHSLFGASKLAADVMVQEYGRYFGMPTCCLRGGCLTGPNHSGVELHGFLSYLIKCNVFETEYTVYGYKGKQVRDNIHSYDVASFIWAFLQKPRIAEVYNIGGGRENSISILEAFKLVESISRKPMKYRYSEQNRIGDHVCYISDQRKMKEHFPQWQITKNLETTFREIYEAWLYRKA
jgi:CDP-paratose 2-epimerase